MRSESQVGAKGGRVRPESGSRRGAARKSLLRRAALEGLEARALLATLPAATLVPGSLVDISNSRGNESTPSIAIDRNNPDKLAAVWTRNDPALAPGPTRIVEAATSNDGGQTWTPLFAVSGPIEDPTTSNPVLPFPQSDNVSVAFDRNDNFYILRSDHKADNSVGALVLDKFDFTNSTPGTVFTDKVVYEWDPSDQALLPTLAVDDNVPSFTDTDYNGQTVTQTDPYSGNVYIAWGSIDNAYNGAPSSVFNPYRIKMIASSDGGTTFTGQAIVNANSNSQFTTYQELADNSSLSTSTSAEAAPRIVISQGTATASGQTATVSGGLVTVVWDDFSGGNSNTPKNDYLVSGNDPVGGTAAVGTSTGGGILDAEKGANSAPDTPSVTDFPINVNVTDPKFISVSHVELTLNLTSPNLNELSAVLIPPQGSGLPQVTLFVNQTNSSGTSNTNVGISGANLGLSANGTQIGTTFDDNAPRTIIDRTVAAPFIGHFRPENGNFGLDAAYGGATPTLGPDGINGQWILRITDYRNSGSPPPPEFLNNATLNFTSGLVPDKNNYLITQTQTLRGGPYGTGTIATSANPQTVAPDLSVASDNTLGAYSPYEGRIYATYTDRQNYTNNPADNTDIFLMYSDDGGKTWLPSGADNGVFGQSPVNDDNALSDGYSEANGTNAGRPQFESSVAVDDATGMLVLSWYDARNDASRARVATYVTTSIDGGQTFSPDVYANPSQTATDAITGQTVNLGPIPDNQSSGNPNTETTTGFGIHQGLAVYGGKIYPIWSSNLNGGSDGKALLDIRTAVLQTAAGPRIISSTMGPVGGPDDTLNAARASDGGPEASAFIVTFDRPVDPGTFTTNEVQVFYRDTTPNNATGGPVPVTKVVPLDLGPYGATQFEVDFAPRSGVGTYSYSVGPGISDRIRTDRLIVTPQLPAQSFAATDVPQPYGSNQTVVSQVQVSGFTAAQVISDLTVNLNISDNFDYPLTVTLIAPDGTAITLIQNSFYSAQGFNVTLDDSATRSINNSFPPYVGRYRPTTPLSKLKGNATINGTWTLQVSNSNSFESGSLNSWSLNITPGTLSTASNTGNQMDQNANGTAGETTGGDTYAVPIPTNGTPFTGPYSQDSLPLIVPGPHIVSSDVPGAPASSDNLVQNAPVNSIDVTFDRDMNPSSFGINPAVTTPQVSTEVLRVMGPDGLVAGPYTIQANPLGSDPDPNFPRTYRIGFPAQQLSGTYVVTLGASITSSTGDEVDNNLNAGVDLLKGVASGPTVSTTYSASVPASGTAIPDGGSVASTLSVPASFPVQGVTVQLNITHANDPDLTAILIAPDGTQVQLFANVGSTGTHANFSGTIFDDSATTPIANGGPPFFGRFNPQQPLSGLNSKDAQGTWTLLLEDTNKNRISGKLNSWSLTFQQSLPGSGLGEPVADQSSVSFRIFNQSPTNPLSSNTWTPVGPVSVGTALGTTGTGTNLGSFSGRIGAIAVDPSDPSGNTVYVAGASGGVWKTSDFLTTDPNGPTYIPLTDFGPTSGLNIGSIAVFGRNNDPNQSIVVAGTGFGDGLEGLGGNATQGVGFLLSKDGGATWTLLDSTDNTLPFAQRDHIFAAHTTVDTTTSPPTVTQVGADSTYKVLVDPNPTPDGNVIIYAALSGPTGGLWRSVDTGLHWQKLSDDTAQGTSATDIAFDLNSATVDAVSNPTGNVNTIYVAFQASNGAPGGVYISPNRGQTLDPMVGQNVNYYIRDIQVASEPPIPVNGVATPPTGMGRIVLAKPTPLPASAANADVENKLYEGWLYALIATPDGREAGLFMTKDNGQTWTAVKTLTIPSQVPGVAVPTNNNTDPNYDVLSSPNWPNADYNMSLVVDPTNPNIVYVGGSSDGTNQSGLIRVDVSKIYDSHALVAYDNSRSDGGQLMINTTGRVAVKKNTDPNPYIADPFDPNQGAYLNLLQDPNTPFATNSTLYVYNAASFTNDGTGTTWTPFDQILIGNQATYDEYSTDGFNPSVDAPVTTNVHRVVAITDPLTGHARLIFGDDQGIFTGVDNNGTLDFGIGTAGSATFSRNGNLQITQFYYGASQPSATAANNAGALFYGNSDTVGFTGSDPNILTDGNLQGTAPNDLEPASSAGVGVGVDQQGNDVVYQYAYPGFNGLFTNFFQVSTDGGKTFVSRTNGLIQANVNGYDPQWPAQFTLYPGGTTNGNFTVNPLNSNSVIISSNAGRIFSTIDQGRTWLVIGQPTSLDSTYAPALTFGAPDPTAPGGIGNLNNFIYAGTVGGNIFVTRTGGGSVNGGAAWTKISTGLDGSAVLKIVADPTRGSHDAYAVTTKGVYYNANTIAANSTWVNITGPTDAAGNPTTGNILAILQDAFGDPTLANTKASYLTSIQADWRYVIPNTTGTGTHPILYVSADSGVYRSLDNGATWSLFPSMAIDNSPVDGGNLPDVQVSDLDMALGNIDPTTGRAVSQPGDPNALLATTYGRGQFTIRLAPVVFPNTTTQPSILSLSKTQPAPGGSQSGTDANGHPVVTTPVPVINGFSEQTAFGNVVWVTIWDLTDPNNPKIIGGYDPSNPSTDVAANQTDSTGKFSVQVNSGAFLSNGVKTLGIQATDGSGTQGNMATLVIDLQAALPLPQPPAKPTLGLLLSDDTSGSKGVTSDATPHVIDVKGSNGTGLTDPKVSVVLQLIAVNGQSQAPQQIGAATTSDASGNFSIQVSQPGAATTTPLADGTYTVQAVATNSFGSTTSSPFTFTIKTQGPKTAPSFNLVAADDTGIQGDGITSARRPRFTGTADPGVTVQILNAANNQVIGSTTSDANTGAFTLTLASNLTDGSIGLVARSIDVAGNLSPLSAPLNLVIATVPGDYTGATTGVNGVTTATSDPALFRRVNPGLAQWFIQGVPPATGINFGSGTLDVPLEGDFDGDGKDDLAIYRPSTATWIINQTTAGPVLFAFGQPDLDMPVVGNFSGTGRTTVGVYRPTTGQWFLAGVAAPPQVISVPGYTPALGDIPAPGNYLGQGADQFAVYRPSTAQLFVNGATGPIQVGTTGSITSSALPVPGAYDNLARFAASNNPASEVTEAAVFDPLTGLYTIDGPGGSYAVQFQPGDVAAPGDYDGIGQTEPAVYRPSTGQILYYAPTGSAAPGAGQVLQPNKTIALQGTQGGDIPVAGPYNVRKLPVAGDYNKNGHADIALVQRVNGTLQWYVQGGTAAPTNGVVPPGSASFGAASLDVPVQGDFNGDHVTDLAVYRPSTGQWFVGGHAGVFATFGGDPSDIPAPGSFDNLGYDQVAVYRRSTGQWFIGGHANGISFGGPGDIPVPADYDGVGRTELAVYRPSTGEWFIGGHATSQVINVPGYTPAAGDIPAPADYDGIGEAELAVYRPSTGQFFLNGHATPISYGGPGFVPPNAPVQFRMAGTSVGASSVSAADYVIGGGNADMGASALALATKPNATAATAAATTTTAAPTATTPAATTVSTRPATGKRPNQAATQKTHLHDVVLGSFLKLQKTARAHQGHQA